MYFFIKDECLFKNIVGQIYTECRDKSVPIHKCAIKLTLHSCTLLHVVTAIESGGELNIDVATKTPTQNGTV